MPTYDFRCAECDHRFSDFVNIKDKDSERCPKCGGNAKQLFTGFLFISKGRSQGGTSCSSCSGSNCSTCGN